MTSNSHRYKPSYLKKRGGKINPDAEPLSALYQNHVETAKKAKRVNSVRAQNEELRNKVKDLKKQLRHPPIPTKYKIIDRIQTPEGIIVHMPSQNPPQKDIRTLAPDEVTLSKIFEVSRLMGAHAYEADFAAALQVSKSTWKRFKADYPNIVEDEVERGLADHRMSLMRLQQGLAEGTRKGSVPMAIFLGETMLGQSKAASKSEVTVNVFSKIMDTARKISDNAIDVQPVQLLSGPDDTE